MRCSKCKNENLPEGDFYISRVTSRGFSHWCKKCIRISHNSWKVRNPEKAKASEKDRKLRSRYGITEERRCEMLAEQLGKCAVCKKKFTSTRKPKVDHCHRTKKVRGLLCHRCNSGIGYLCEDVSVLRRAIRYLQ